MQKVTKIERMGEGEGTFFLKIIQKEKHFSYFHLHFDVILLEQGPNQESLF